MNTIRIELGERSYPIHIGHQLLGDPGHLRDCIRGSQVLVVSNETIAPLWLAPVEQALAELNSEVLLIADGEQWKSTESWGLITDRLAAMQANRDVTLVALGGGVIGDLTGFAAATWMRGVPFVQIPTTLLAQVDASVGGKTAINHPAGKNLVGAFHQPRAVLIDTATLETLPEREYRSGLAEVIKYGLIGDSGFLDWLQAHMIDLLQRKPAAMATVIQRCCEHKAAVVAADEREGGVRALLNLGHTFGHAIESIAGYGEILHGEAVSIGCVAAAHASRIRGDLDQAAVDRVVDLMQRAGLPVTIPENLATADLMDAMRLDKKNLSGRIRLVLMRSLGDAWVSDDNESDMIRDAIQACRQGI